MTLTQEGREAPRPEICPATVLIVDDDPQAVAALRRTFRGEPYETIFSTDPFEAREWIRQRDVELVITDEFMPGMMGTELLEAVHRRLPDASSILLTGYPNMAVSYRGFQQRVDLLMVKPWNDPDLRSQVRRLLRESGWDVPEPEGGGTETIGERGER